MVLLNSVKQVRFRWQRKKLQIQGAQILSDDSYLAYYEETKDVAQQRIWTFYEAINFKRKRNRIVNKACFIVS